MMIRRRDLLLGASTGIAAAALAGCSGGSGSDGKVTLQMVESLTSPERTKLIHKLIGEFEKANPSIKVQLVSPPTEQADNKIRQMLQAGSGVDVLEVRDLTVGPFSNNGWLHDMSKELKDWDGMDKLTDQAKKFTISEEDGKSFFIPYGFYGLSLYSRTCLLYTSPSPRDRG